MALTTENKLYVAVGVLVVLGGTIYLVNRKQKDEAASYTLDSRAAELPKIQITEEQTKGVDRVVITQPAGDAGKAEKVVLKKEGDQWKLVEPIAAKANDANVKSVLDNLHSLKVTELINPSKDTYAKYDLDDAKALHATFYKGDQTVTDLYFGEGGSRGQMTRIAGKDGVYATKGYSSFLYSRDLKGWRDLTVFKFEEKDVKAVDIKNENGTFAFAKSGEEWSSKHTKPKGGAAAKLDRFDKAKVEDMIRAFKGLNADNFAAPGKTEADLGLDKPIATLIFSFNDGAKKEVLVGSTAEGSSRWTKATGFDPLFSVSSWAADWATAKPEKFQKPEEKKGEKKDDKDEAAAMPGMPGMPPGMAMPPMHPEED